MHLVRGPSVYIITSEALNNLYKIGFSMNIETRLKSYHTSIPGDIRVEHIQYFRNPTAMRLAEKLLHYALNSYRPKDNKEWFQTDDVSIFVTKLDNVADFVNGIVPVDFVDPVEDVEIDDAEEWGRECTVCCSFLAENDLKQKGEFWYCEGCVS